MDENNPFGAFGGMMGMIKQAQEQAARMQEELNQKLAETSVEGTAGGGMVKVVMNAAQEVKKVEIEPAVIDPEDKEMLEDLIAAAFNAARKKAVEAETQLKGKQLDGMQGMPGMGGFDLSKLFGG